MTRAAWPEIVLFAVLLLASLGVAWLRFRKVLRVVRGARPEPLKLRLGPRLRRFVFEVLFQTKVIRERPLPGLAHAVVFWGFCAFALATLNHLAEGFGLTLLSPHSAAARVYLSAVGLFAAAVLVAIAGLAARRFLVRPVWLGHLSPESGLIAGLIFTLMLTYLLGIPFPMSRVNWWVHTLALLVFLPLIPGTKHLHLALSPFAILLRREGFGNIPPLGEEDFGIENGASITRLTALQVYACVECGRCTEHCPASNTGKVLNPKEVILGARRYLNELGPAASQPIVDGFVPAEAIFACTTCGACEYQCPVGIEHLPLIVGLRRGVVNTGRWEDDYGARFFQSLERCGNVLGFPAAERQKFIERGGLPLFDGSQEYCLWLGCMGSFDPQGRDIVLALAKVLAHLGIGFGVLRREKCTGDAARRLGNDYMFQQMAEANIEQLTAAKVKKLVSICPHCVRTIGTDWREFGAQFAIEHHSELLARFAAKLPQAPPGGRKLVFHDPCYLGRYRGVYESPRRVAAAGGAVSDPPRARGRARCCGAGGGLIFLGDEKGERMNVERARELAATRADAIATACPFCHSMFRDALGGLGPAPPQLVDIAQLAAESIARR